MAHVDRGKEKQGRQSELSHWRMVLRRTSRHMTVAWPLVESLLWLHHSAELRGAARVGDEDHTDDTLPVAHLAAP